MARKKGKDHLQTSLRVELLGWFFLRYSPSCYFIWSLYSWPYLIRTIQLVSWLKTVTVTEYLDAVIHLRYSNGAVSQSLENQLGRPAGETAEKFADQEHHPAAAYVQPQNWQLEFHETKIYLFFPIAKIYLLHDYLHRKIKRVTCVFKKK